MHKIRGKIWQEIQEFQKNRKEKYKKFLEDRFNGDELLNVAKQDAEFLDLTRRAQQILDKPQPVEFIEFQDRRTLKFTVEAGEEPYSKTGPTAHYFNTVKLYDLDSLMEGLDITEVDSSFMQEAVLEAFKGDIGLHSTCPSYKFWGFQYFNTQGDSALYPEGRRPDERNPDRERGGLCKHGFVLLKEIIENKNSQLISEIANGLMTQLKIGKFD